MTTASALERLAGARAPSAWIVLVSIGLLHGAYVLSQGVAFGSDSGAYDYWSARLIESGFDYARLIGEARTSFPAVLYVLFATLLALLRLAFGAGWQVGLLALNFGAHLALGVLLVRLATRVTGSAAGGWAALFLYLGSFDLLVWVPFVLSDATFVFLAFAIFTLAAARILGEARNWLPILAVAAGGIFYRPTGMVLVPDLVWAAYLAKARTIRVRRSAALATLALATTALAFAFAWFMQDPGRWPFEFLARAFRDTASGYAAGEVVSARPETFHSPPGELVDFVLISADRFRHFFAFDAAGFSLVHRLASLAFFLPCYALASWLAVALWRGRTAFAERERKVLLAAYGALFSYTLFHALVQVDFDWRYRLPVLPHLILVAAAGLADLVRRARAR